MILRLKTPPFVAPKSTLSELYSHYLISIIYFEIKEINEITLSPFDDTNCTRWTQSQNN